MGKYKNAGVPVESDLSSNISMADSERWVCNLYDNLLCVEININHDSWAPFY